MPHDLVSDDRRGGAGLINDKRGRLRLRGRHGGGMRNGGRLGFCRYAVGAGSDRSRRIDGERHIRMGVVTAGAHMGRAAPIHGILLAQIM